MPGDPCTGMLSDGETNINNDVIASDDVFYQWLLTTTQIATYYGSYIHAGSTENDVNSAFTALTESNADLTAVKTCLTTNKPTPETDQAILISKIDTAKKSLVTLNNDIQVAQDRALLVRNPELSRSYYEGLLPIARPMKQSSIPVLIGASMFLFSLSFFMLLSAMNIRMETILTLPAFMTGSTEYQQLGKQFFTLLGASIILFGLTIYAFTRNT